MEKGVGKWVRLVSPGWSIGSRRGVGTSASGLFFVHEK